MFIISIDREFGQNRGAITPLLRDRAVDQGNLQLKQVDRQELENRTITSEEFESAYNDQVVLVRIPEFFLEFQNPILDRK